MERHKREIFPLLHRRTLFADTDNFLLFDFHSDSGSINEDVFAYSNSNSNEYSLVIFNNRFSETSGGIQSSTPYLVKGAGKKNRIMHRSIAEAIRLDDRNDFLIYRDQCSGLEFIHPAQQIKENGMHFNLHAYQYHCLVDFRQIQDDAWHSYRHLCDYLDGRGVPSISEALHELILAPVQKPYSEICNPGYLNFLLSNRKQTLPSTASNSKLRKEAEQKCSALLDGIRKIAHVKENPRVNEIHLISIGFDSHIRCHARAIPADRIQTISKIYKEN